MTRDEKRSCNNCMYRRVCITRRDCGDMAWICDTYERYINRDTLLELVDEMDKWALTCDHYDRKVSPIEVTRYANCIREALGVSDDY